jgi:transcriptional regulator with XRE-family HTH domain
MPDSLGDLIRAARRDSRASLRATATALGISASYLSDIENDRRTPAEELLQAIAAHLSLSWDELMAHAGRLGDEAQRYLERHPSAGRLIRWLAAEDVPDEEVARCLARWQQPPPPT